MNKYLIEILKEMCKRVGIRFEDLDLDNPEWYMAHSWKQAEEKDFQAWLTDYLYGNNRARKDLLKVPLKKKSHLREAAEEFCFQYGWRYED